MCVCVTSPHAQRGSPRACVCVCHIATPSIKISTSPHTQQGSPHPCATPPHAPCGSRLRGRSTYPCVPRPTARSRSPPPAARLDREGRGALDAEVEEIEQRIRVAAARAQPFDPLPPPPSSPPSSVAGRAIAASRRPTPHHRARLNVFGRGGGRVGARGRVSQGSAAGRSSTPPLDAPSPLRGEGGGQASHRHSLLPFNPVPNHNQHKHEQKHKHKQWWRGDDGGALLLTIIEPAYQSVGQVEAATVHESRNAPVERQGARRVRSGISSRPRRVTAETYGGSGVGSRGGRDAPNDASPAATSSHGAASIAATKRSRSAHVL